MPNAQAGGGNHAPLAQLGKTFMTAFYLDLTGGVKVNPRQLIKNDKKKIAWLYMLILIGENGAMKDALWQLHLLVKQEVRGSI